MTPVSPATVKDRFDRERKWDIRFLELCMFIARWSKDPSTKCGAVIVRDTNKIVQPGYNGYAIGVHDDNTLHVREEKYPRILHAELNAILLARQNLEGCTVYVHPLPPCSQCAAAIIQAGIKRVVSVVPMDEERKKRWEGSNNIASQMFCDADVLFKLYPEDQIKLF